MRSGDSHFLILLAHHEMSFLKPRVVGENGLFRAFLLVLVLFKGEGMQENFRQTPSDTSIANLWCSLGDGATQSNRSNYRLS